MSGIMIFELLPSLTQDLESFWDISILTCLQGKENVITAVWWLFRITHCSPMVHVR
jgi:hypothetical protein